MARYATVADYVAALPRPLSETTDSLLPIIEGILPGAGAIWHGHPVWSLGPAPGKSPVCYVKGYKDHLSFGLWRGQEVADPSGRLEPGAREMAQVRLRSPQDVDADLFADWLSQARGLGG